MRTKPALIIGAMLLLFVWLMAQPVPVIRFLRDLLDVGTTVPPSNGDVLTYNSTIANWTNTPSSSVGNSNIVANSYTTNSPGKTPNLLSTSTNPLFPISVENPDGSGGDRTISYTPGFSLTGSNLNVPGNITANGGAFTNSLTLNGVAVSTNNGAAGTTNYYDTTVITNNFFVTGKGATLIMTNYVQFPFNSLSLSGSNVSAINLATGSAYKLLLTNSAFFGIPTGFPGTNLMQTIQLHVQQDSTGSRSLTFTNSSWALAGSGASTNAVAAIDTNANSISIITFATSPFNAAKMFGVTSPFPP